MKLYSSKTSPFARKVRVAIEELGLADQVTEEFTDPFNPPPEFLAVNPLSKVPALLTENNEAIPDSSLIIEYLQTRAPRPHKFVALPRDGRRWAILRRQQIAEGILGAAVATVLEKRRPESIIYTSFLDRQAEVIRRSVALLNREAATLIPDKPGVLEITAGVALAYLDFRMPYLDWRRGHEALTEWQAVFAQRPSMLKTQPPA